MTKEELRKASCKTRLQQLGPEDSPPSIPHGTRPRPQKSMTDSTGTELIPEDTGSASLSSPPPGDSAAGPLRQAQSAETTGSDIPVPTYKTMSSLFSAVDQLNITLSREAPVPRRGDTTIPSTRTPGGSSTPSASQTTTQSTLKALNNGPFFLLPQVSPTVYSPSNGHDCSPGPWPEVPRQDSDFSTSEPSANLDDLLNRFSNRPALGDYEDLLFFI